MASDTTQPSTVVDLKDDSGSDGRYLPVVEWLASEFSQPYSKAAVLAAVPDGFERKDGTVLARALQEVGLKSSLVVRDLREVDPIVLPCVLFLKSGQPIILTGFANGRKHARIIDLSKGEFEEEILTRKLRREVQKSLLLVTEQASATAQRLGPETRAMASDKSHWLWKPLRDNWSAWAQIVVAALGINLFGLALPIFVMNVYDRVIPNLAFVTLWTLAIGVLIALVLDMILRTVRVNVLELASRRIDLVIASKLFRQAMRVKLLSRSGGAAGMANHIRDFEMVRDFFVSSSFVAMIDLAFIGIFVTVLWVIVGPIAIVPLLAVPIVVLLAFFAQIPIGRTVKQSQQLSTKRHIVLVESLLGIETIKSVNGEPTMQREWENAIAASARINGKTRFWSNFATSGTQLIQQGVSVVIIFWGVFLVSEGAITVGGLIAANILAGRVLQPLGNISQTLIRAQLALKAMAAISDHMQLPVEGGDTVVSDLRVKKGEVSLKGVTFTYPGAPEPALKDVSFDIKEGETVALLGRVGSGKTTLGKLLCGLVEAESGLVLVDGYELAQFERAELRDGIGYLPQDPELFTGTIRENLLLGQARATDEDLNRALYFAGMDTFIQENPEGLNQFVGEKGNRLSGGQRQAVAIARLLLRRPKLLFLDEPTNAMDSQTETTVISRLNELKKEGVGMILSTHRNSLAAIADRTIIIDKGVKILDGTSTDVMTLLKKNAAKKGG
ncbi:MAG: type I secretion system permease/ATPase [Hyphomicrobiales bacterium]